MGLIPIASSFYNNALPQKYLAFLNIEIIIDIHINLMYIIFRKAN